VLCRALQEYGQLIDATLEYYDAMGSEEASEMVLRADDAPVNMYDDINPELIGAIDAFGDDEEGFSREGQFVERILELGRVTKVRGARWFLLLVMSSRVWGYMTVRAKGAARAMPLSSWMCSIGHWVWRAGLCCSFRQAGCGCVHDGAGGTAGVPMQCLMLVAGDASKMND
jgi:hypothetical protein